MMIMFSNSTLHVTILFIILSFLFIGASGLLLIVERNNITKAREEAEDFLIRCRSELYSYLIDILRSYDYDNTEDLRDIEYILINKMQLSAKNAIRAKIENSKDILSRLTIKFLDDKTINDFIYGIINEIDVFDFVAFILRAKAESFQETIMKEDKQLEQEYSDSRLYYENDTDVKLSSASEIEYDQEELDKLNPPSDEEESYDATDESMELIPDNITIDSKGRMHDKQTGKYIKNN